MTDEEKTEKKMMYIHKMAQEKGIDYQNAYKLAIVQEYLQYVDSIIKINSQ